MGIPGQFDHPDFLEAVKTITEVAKELKKPGGIHVVEPNPEEVSNAIDQGHKFIAYSVDIRMLDNMCRDVFIKTQALK
jgi:2-dehydro-3-deoxyglucarate aldolase